MKTKGKIKFFVVFALILALAYTAFFGISYQYGDVKTTYVKGISDIRWGIDIQGGVEATFTPAEGVEASDSDLDAAVAVMKLRLVNLNITDYEVYSDYSKQRIIVRFPWKSGETDFDPEAAIAELGQTAELKFVGGTEADGEVLFTGSYVENAEAVYYSNSDNSDDVSYAVKLTLDDEGEKLLEEATTKYLNDYISVWLDDECISTAVVQEVITGGVANISSSSFTAEEATDLANKIEAGALPFELTTDNFNTISPTLGANAKQAMMIAGAIALILVCLYMIILYRTPGIVASIALIGQLAGSIACITGYLSVFDSFTLTLPGMAGVILGIGFGVDSNIITADRIREEIRKNRSVSSAINIAFKNGFTAIFDGQITVIIVAAILMGAFGPSNSFFATLLSPIMHFFPSAITGTVYSFGFTLLVSVVMNFIFGVGASRIMLRALSNSKFFGSAKMFGGDKNAE